MKIRPRSLLVLPCMIAMSMSSAMAKAHSPIPLVPDGGTKIAIILQGKERMYQVLPNERPATIKVEGPGAIKIITRAIVPAADTGTVYYSIDFREGKSVIKKYTTSATKSTAQLDKTGKGKAVCKGRTCTLKVPRGRHTYELVPGTARQSGSVAVRMSFQQAGEKMVAIEALTYEKTATISVNEKLLTYFIATPQKPISIKIVGPTSLSIVSRLNFEPSMRGNQNYMIVVSENGAAIKKARFQTVKSMTASYQEIKSVVAGKSKTCSVPVPAGVHTYTVSFGKTNAQSIGVRFLIAQTDTQNGSEEQ